MIEVTKAGTVLTGKGLDLYFLLSLQSALNLELKGIRIRRNFSALKRAKEVTGLKTNDRQKHIDALRDMVNELSAKVTRVFNDE